MKKLILILLSVMLLTSCTEQSAPTEQSNLTENTLTEATDNVTEPASEAPTEPATDVVHPVQTIEEVFAGYEIKYGTLIDSDDYNKIAEDAVDNYSGDEKKYFAMAFTDAPGVGMLICVGAVDFSLGTEEVHAWIEQIYAFGRLVTLSEWNDWLYVIGHVLEAADVKADDKMLVCSSFRGGYNLFVTEEGVFSYEPAEDRNFYAVDGEEGLTYYLVNDKFREMHDISMFIDAYETPDEFRDERGVIRIEDGELKLVPTKTQTVQQWYRDEYRWDKYGCESVEEFVEYHNELYPFLRKEE